MEQGYVKNNGFTKRPHLLQILSYIFFIITVPVYTVVVIPLGAVGYAVPLAIFYYSVTLLVIYFGYVCTVSDPTDDVVKLYRETQRRGEAFDTTNYEYFCSSCRSSVCDSSKHCWQCNRCVSDFDHHCKWINNCVSKKNYKSFMILICGVALSTFFFCIPSIIIIIRYGVDPQSLIHDVLWYKDMSAGGLRTLSIINLVLFTINFIFLVLDCKLLSFHIWLIRNKLTTYEYIKKMREKDLERLETTLRNKKPNKVKNKVVPLGPDKDQLALDTKRNMQEPVSSPAPQIDKKANKDFKDQNAYDLNPTTFESKFGAMTTITTQIEKQQLRPNGSITNRSGATDEEEDDLPRKDFKQITINKDIIQSELGPSDRTTYIREIEPSDPSPNQNNFLMVPKISSSTSFSTNYSTDQFKKNPEDYQKKRTIHLSPIDTRTERTPQKTFFNDRKDDLRFSPSTLSVDVNDVISRPYSMTILEEKKEA